MTTLRLFEIHSELGTLEQEVLELTWQTEKLTVRDVVEKLQKNRPVAYTTVETVLGHLYQKGFLGRRLQDKSYFYFPLVSAEKALIMSFLQTAGDLFWGIGARIFVPLLLPAFLVVGGYFALELIQNLDLSGTTDFFARTFIRAWVNLSPY